MGDGADAFADSGEVALSEPAKPSPLLLAVSKMNARQVLAALEKGADPNAFGTVPGAPPSRPLTFLLLLVITRTSKSNIDIPTALESDPTYLSREARSFRKFIDTATTIGVSLVGAGAEFDAPSGHTPMSAPISQVCKTRAPFFHGPLRVAADRAALRKHVPAADRTKNSVRSI